MSRISLAFKAFFAILFGDGLPAHIAEAFGYVHQSSVPKPAPAPKAVEVRSSDGALQILSILQRDSRLIDFLMEDVSSYSDGQIGAAVRTLHDQCRDAVSRYVTLQPVIDGVEGTFTRVPSASPDLVKFVGNVPAQPPSGGILRHKGWRAANVDLPTPGGTGDVTVLAPAEIEIE